MAGNSLNVQLCQRLLCDHGRFPHEVLNLPLKEKLLMQNLYEKELKEHEEAKNRRSY